MKEIIKNLTRRKFAVVASAPFALFIFACSVETRAQVEPAPLQTPSAQAETEAQPQPANAPLELLRVLNLTTEQRTQIGAIRRETAPQGRVLGMRLRQARRALDEAMYSDKPDEGVIETRVREVSEAQAAVVRLRTLTELKIRRVLTPEQLNAFRQLQRQSRTRQQRQRRMNQPSPQGDLPDEAAPAERLRNRMQRRRQERQQQRQQQPMTSDPNVQPLAAPREQRRPATLRKTRPLR